MSKLAICISITLAVMTIVVPSAPAPGASVLGVAVAEASGALTGTFYCLGAYVTGTHNLTLRIGYGAPYLNGLTPAVATRPSLTVVEHRLPPGSGQTPSDTVIPSCNGPRTIEACLVGSASTGFDQADCQGGYTYAYGWHIGPLGPATSVKYGITTAPAVSGTVDFGPFVYVT